VLSDADRTPLAISACSLETLCHSYLTPNEEQISLGIPHQDVKWKGMCKNGDLIQQTCGCRINRMRQS